MVTTLAEHHKTPGEGDIFPTRRHPLHFCNGARITSLLVAIAFAAAPDKAEALGVTQPCPCAAGPREVCWSVEAESGGTETKCVGVIVEEAQCGEQDGIVPCVGAFNCQENVGWVFADEVKSCDSLSTRSGCEEAGGGFSPPVPPACCGKCVF